MAIGTPYGVGTAAAKSVSVTTFSVTLTAPIPAGQTVFLAAAFNAVASGTSVTATDSEGNTYTATTALSSSLNVNGAVFRAEVESALLAGDTITVTIGTAVSRWALSAFGVAGVTTIDRVFATSATNDTATATFPGATNQADELVVAYAALGGPSTPVIASPFVMLPQAGTTGGTATTNITLGLGYRIVSALGTYAASYSSLGSISTTGAKVVGISSYFGGTYGPPPDESYAAIDLTPGYQRWPQIV